MVPRVVCGAGGRPIVSSEAKSPGGGFQVPYPAAHLFGKISILRPFFPLPRSRKSHVDFLNYVLRLLDWFRARFSHMNR